MKNTRRKNQSRAKRPYFHNTHTSECATGVRHQGPCSKQVAEKSESPRTRRGSRSQAKPDVEKSGRGNTTKRTRRTARRAEKEGPVEVSLGNLDEQPNGAFVYEIDDDFNIVGFDGDVINNVNYTKFSYADETDIDDGDLVLHRREFMDFQIHNVGVGALEDGDSVTILVVPNLDIDWHKVSIGDIFDGNNHMK